MSYCLNPHCPNPQNSDDSNFCLTCGAKLLLRERYRAIRPIGHGGFGKTFLAVDEDKPSRPPAVIKQFFPQTQGTSNVEKAAELFHREAVRLDELGKHPQIPELLAHFEQEGNLYLVQEYIDGSNLAEEIARKGTFNETQIRQVLDDLLPVLHFMHYHQVIHRDIKPANIIRRHSTTNQSFLNPKTVGQLVLVDFGAAKVFNETQIPGTGTIIGSPEYIAPEQARGQAGFTSDIYSLGVTCLYLLTQISPFDLFDIHEDRWVWRDYLKGNSLSPQLGRILDKMVASQPNKRYPTALAVIDDLHPQTLPPAIRQSLAYAEPVSTTTPASPPPVKPQPSQPSTQFPQPQRVSPSKKTSSWRCLYTLTGHRNAVTAVAFSPDGENLVSASQDQTIEVWWRKTGKRWYTLTGHTNWVTTLAFSPNGEMLASGSRDNTVEIWDMTKGKRWFTLIGHTDGVEKVAMSPDGNLLASASRDHTIKLWDLIKAKQHFSLSGHTDRVYTVAFHPTGKWLVSGSRDQTIRFWDIQTGKELGRLSGHTDWVRDIAISPDGNILATASRDGMIKVWQLQNLQWGLKRTLRADEVDIFTITFSPNSQILVSGNQKGQVDVWQVETGMLLETIAAHSQDVLSVAFSENGQQLLTGSYDRTVKLWETRS
jgi:WD40 repeat protein